MADRDRYRRRSNAPEEVYFPVVPMLDMAFQLLAFFILTFQTPTGETRIDLYLPAAPLALPTAPRGEATPRPSRVEADEDLESDLVIRARSDDLGELAGLTLSGSEVDGPVDLQSRLRRYRALLGTDRPLRVVLIADDRLRYEAAAQIVGACSAAGIRSIRLADPADPRAQRAPAAEPSP